MVKGTSVNDELRWILLADGVLAHESFHGMTSKCNVVVVFSYEVLYPGKSCHTGSPARNLSFPQRILLSLISRVFALRHRMPSVP